MNKILIVVFLNVLFSTLQAQYSISGTVQNEMGEPLIGASVFLHRTDHATISNEKGEFILDNLEEEYYLLKCSYLGYESLTEGFEIDKDLVVDLILIRGVYTMENIEIFANKLDVDSPFPYRQIGQNEIDIKNIGQDIPSLLEHTPSMLVTSDAGNGIGYSGMRIRGSDATRVNVTINGVPLNDSESQGVFWVNLPDFSSSLSEIQIQRGVGPSTNGSSAFGATVALNTNKVFENPFVRMNSSYGSFNSRKISVSMNTGLIDNSFMIEGRYSLIKSDGYIDRASSDLKSWFFSAAKINKKSSIRFNAFSGKEVTYQAWNGVPQALLDESLSLEGHYNNNKGVLYLTELDSINLFTSGRTYNYYTYENQVDDYSQSHMQLIYNVQLNDNVRVNSTWHHTLGKGFFEQFKYQDELSFYGILNDNVDVTNVVRRRWLDNRFYGTILNVEWDLSERTNLFVGGSYNRYDGDHYGEIVATSDSLNTAIPRSYYENNGLKTDLNFYAKVNSNIGKKMHVFLDVQNRRIQYDAFGEDNDGLNINVDKNYNFFNPKLGINYAIRDSIGAYFSFARAQKEPIRSDFTDAIGISVPNPEILNDFELGIRMQKPDYLIRANGYFMYYKDQLVLTGAINDVGAPVRVNVDDSYRFGIEIEGEWAINSKWLWSPNITWSRNKIKTYNEILVDYDTGDIIMTEFNNTDIAFSPSIIAGQKLQYHLNDDFVINILSKYVGSQFLDNTGIKNRQLDGYIVNDLILEYSFDLDMIEDLKIKLLVNNFLNNKYSSNGYSYSYKLGDIITENFLFPQAGINFLLNLAVKF